MIEVACPKCHAHAEVEDPLDPGRGRVAFMTCTSCGYRSGALAFIAEPDRVKIASEKKNRANPHRHRRSLVLATCSLLLIAAAIGIPSLRRIPPRIPEKPPDAIRAGTGAPILPTVLPNLVALLAESLRPEPCGPPEPSGISQLDDDDANDFVPPRPLEISSKELEELLPKKFGWMWTLETIDFSGKLPLAISIIGNLRYPDLRYAIAFRGDKIYSIETVIRTRDKLKADDFRERAMAQMEVPCKILDDDALHFIDFLSSSSPKNSGPGVRFSEQRFGSIDVRVEWSRRHSTWALHVLLQRTQYLELPEVMPIARDGDSWLRDSFPLVFK